MTSRKLLGASYWGVGGCGLFMFDTRLYLLRTYVDKRSS